MRWLPDSYSIPLFVCGAYLISWPIWLCASHFHGAVHLEIFGLTFDVPHQAIVLLLGDIGPGLSATVVTLITEGWPRVCQLWGGLKIRRPNPVWPIVFVVLFAPTVYSVALFAYWCLGGTIASFGSPIRLLFLIAFNLPFAPLWEEIGWRGFLLPKLEARRSGLRASLILACIWGPWHLPIYWNSSSELIWFLTMIGPLAVLFTWIYNRSQGSLVPVVILHLMINTLNLYLLWPTMRASGLPPFEFVAELIFCVAAFVLMCVGPDLGRNSLLGLTPTSGMHSS